MPAGNPTLCITVNETPGKTAAMLVAKQQQQQQKQLCFALFCLILCVSVGLSWPQLYYVHMFALPPCFAANPCFD